MQFQCTSLVLLILQKIKVTFPLSLQELGRYFDAPKAANAISTCIIDAHLGKHVAILKTAIEAMALANTATPLDQGAYSSADFEALMDNKQFCMG